MSATEECTVYSAVTEGYDKDKLTTCNEQHVKFELRIGPSDIKYKREATLWNREQKWCHPPQHGLTSLYLDGSLSPKVPIRLAVECWLATADFALFKHPWRDCAYDEIDECVRVGKVTAVEAEKARSTLLLAGFPRHFGLWACGMIARRVHANAIQMFAAPLVYQYVKDFPRDQVWFPFILWKLNHSLTRVHTIDRDIYNNKWLTFRRHGS